ncbi:MAG TPA: type VI secretion system TssO [Puia sp.]|nr:type VI secretion system TssO [Puia sp.]
MQTILNSKDRNQAFLKFLVLFLVTVTLCVLAVYFDYRLPVRENRVLQEEVALQRQQDVDQQKFAGKMQEALVLMDSVDKAGVNTEQIEIQFNGKLNDLSVLQLKDNTAYGLVDKAIIYRLSELWQAKKNQASLTEKAQHAEEAQNQVAQLQQQINTLNQTLATYQHK